MNLALFDLDNTLLSGDSDHTWGVFLAKIGAVDATSQTAAQDKFYQQYLNGSLDIHEFLEFQFTPLKENSLTQLKEWRSEYIETHIKPLISQARIDLVKKHLDQEHEVIVITATNSFITRPIVDLFGIEHLIATEPEIIDNQFTGKLFGTPCFQEGKIKKLNHFLKNNYDNQEISNWNSFFYSDSHNDLPLMKLVDTAIAVTPDDTLREFALDNNWEVID